MSAQHTDKQARPSALKQIRSALVSAAETTPVRLAFERRRLLASVYAEKTPHRIFNLKRAAAVSFAFAVFALAAFFVFHTPHTKSTADISPHTDATPKIIRISGLIRAEEGKATDADTLHEVPGFGGAKIVWKDETALWVGGASTLSFFQTQTGVHFRKGRILASVTPKQNAHTFEVETPLGRVVVHGTVFSVAGDDTHLQVHLHEGAVTFRYAGGTVALTPGQSLEITPNKSPKIRAVDELDIIADLLITEKTAGLPGPPIPDLGARSVEPPEKTHDADAAPQHSRSKSKKKAALKTPSAPPSPSAPKPEPELFLDPENEAVQIESLPKESVEDPAPRIEALLRSGNFEACIHEADAYLKKSPNAPPADRVQFLKACCQTRSGDLKAGRAGFETYLIRFPEGRYWKRVSNILEE